MIVYEQHYKQFTKPCNRIRLRSKQGNYTGRIIKFFFTNNRAVTISTTSRFRK
jgi:hypothetical protein